LSVFGELFPFAERHRRKSALLTSAIVRQPQNSAGLRIWRQVFSMYYKPHFLA
jgi:hypothetical protein